MRLWLVPKSLSWVACSTVQLTALVLLCSAATFSAAGAEARIALLIGNQTYTTEIGRQIPTTTSLCWRVSSGALSSKLRLSVTQGWPACTRP
jgi:hypothetical protein